MSEQQTPHIRQRVNVAQTAKGLHQIDCTIEVLDDQKTAQSAETVAQMVLNLIKATEQKLTADDRKLVVTDG